MLRAIDSAVAGWSPVIMTTSIFADLQLLIASFTPSRGGSNITTNPKKIRSDSTSSLLKDLFFISSTLNSL